jgi:hypothetical protein
MRMLAITAEMIKTVEFYIYKMKGQKVTIDINQIINDERQMNMLIDAFNHAKKQLQ